MRVIEGSGAEGSGGAVVCAACLKEFDQRGGVLFEDPQPTQGQALGQTGLCADCTNQVIETVRREPPG